LCDAGFSEHAATKKYKNGLDVTPGTRIQDTPFQIFSDLLTRGNNTLPHINMKHEFSSLLFIITVMPICINNDNGK
jgi:hypothetical protein